MDEPGITRESEADTIEQRGLAADAAIAFVTSAAGGAGIVTGQAIGQTIADAVTEKLGTNDQPSTIVLPPGVSED